MASAAASMYALSQTANLVGFAKSAAGAGAKNLKITKAKSIAAGFKEKIGTPKGVSDASRQASINFASSNGGQLASKTRLAAQAVGGLDRGTVSAPNFSADRTKSIIANTKAFAPLKGTVKTAAQTIKSPLAAANLAAAKNLGGLGKVLNSFSGGIKSLSGKFTYGAIAAGLAVGALNFFTDSLVEAGKSGKKNAKNLDEVKSAGAKGRLGEALSGATSTVGKTVAGAATGAAIASFIPIVGTVIGGITGGLIGFLDSFGVGILSSLGTTFPLLGALGENISTGVSDLFGGISDSVYVAYQNFNVGSFTDRMKQIGSILSNFSVVGLGKAVYNKVTGKKPEEDNSYGARRLRAEKQKDTLDFNTSQISKDFGNIGYGRTQQLLNPTQKSTLSTKGALAPSLLTGAKDAIPQPLAAAIDAAITATATLVDKPIVNVAIAYGGRREVVDAVKSWIELESAKGQSIAQLVDSLSDEQISAHLYTKGQPDPDLVIRTSGEQRLSGFLLWQSTHSEFYFCEAYWPAFRRIDFLRALRAFTQRSRRYGL